MAEHDSTDTSPELASGAHDHLRFARGVLGKLHEQIYAIDLRPYEEMDAEQAVAQLLPNTSDSPIAELLRLLNETVRMLSSVPVLAYGERTQKPAAPSSDDDFDLEFDLGGPAEEGESQPNQDNFLAEVDGQLTDLFGEAAQSIPSFDEVDGTCGLLAMELEQARNRVRAAFSSNSKWTLITEAEECRRKVHKALGAGEAIINHILEPGTGHDPDRTELARARIVRDGLMAFRRDVQELCTGIDGASKDLIAERSASVVTRMDAFKAERVYVELRAPDRFEINKMKTRLRDENENRFNALKDLEAYVDMLGAVLKREVLVAADKAIHHQAKDDLNGLLGALEVAGSQAPGIFAGIIDQLTLLRWRNREMDLYVNELAAKAAPPTPENIKQLLEYLETIGF